MKVIEGFHINKVQNGTKKGQEYINYGKRYVWRIPERLDGQIDKGDIVWVHSKKGNTDIKKKVLVVDVLENTEITLTLRSVIKVDKKCETNRD